MTFDQILVFHTIIRTGSFKAAAAEVHKTQPAISFAMKKLEEELEHPLFDRTSYRPTLTEHGKSFFERSLPVLEGMSELEKLTGSFHRREEPEINISIDGISPLPKLLKLMKAFGDQFPHTRLNLGFDILAEAERRVLEKDAQIGITHFISEPKSLEIVPITSVQMVPVISTELFRGKKLRKEEDLQEIHQIVVGERKKPSPMTFGLLEKGKKWRLGDNNFKRDIILAGLGWGHLPLHTIERELKEKQLTEIAFKEIHRRDLDINLIRLKRLPLGTVARSLWDELTSLRG